MTNFPKLLLVTLLSLSASPSFARSYLDCATSKWYQTEIILEAPEDIAPYISIENNGALVMLQNTEKKPIFLVHEKKNIYKLNKKKVYKRVNVNNKSKWLKVQHTLITDMNSGKSKKQDAAYLIFGEDHLEEFSTSSKKVTKAFFKRLKSCGAKRPKGFPREHLNFVFGINAEGIFNGINGKATLIPNPSYNPKTPCCEI